MASDINRVMIVGRCVRDSELAYTNSGFAICKVSIAVNRSRKQNDQWVEEPNYFDITIWGKRGESLNQYLTKGQQIAVDGELKQERWEQDGNKRSKVTIEATNIQLVGSKTENKSNASTVNAFEQYKPPQGGGSNAFEDDTIPF